MTIDTTAYEEEKMRKSNGYRMKIERLRRKREVERQKLLKLARRQKLKHDIKQLKRGQKRIKEEKYRRAARVVKTVGSKVAYVTGQVAAGARSLRKKKKPRYMKRRKKGRTVVRYVEREPEASYEAPRRVKKQIAKKKKTATSSYFGWKGMGI